jgi:hypothetical protein
MTFATLYIDEGNLPGFHPRLRQASTNAGFKSA